MKTLPTEFTKKGDTYKQLEREGRAAIYSRTTGTGFMQYEVIIVQQYEERIMAGAVCPATEAFPSTNSWGTLGWTYMAADRAGADARFNQLCIRFGTRKPTPVRRRTPPPTPAAP